MRGKKRIRFFGNKAPRQRFTDVVIGIQPIGQISKKDLRLVKRTLHSFDLRAVILPATTYPTWIRVQRDKVFANEICGWLNRFLKDDLTDIIGVINEPIRGPEATVRGQAHESTCLVRLDDLKTVDGIRHLVMHEVGHLIYLDHCNRLACVMHPDSDPDESSDWFCSTCRMHMIHTVGWTPFLRRQGLENLRKNWPLFPLLVPFFFHIDSPLMFFLAFCTLFLCSRRIAR